MKKYLIFDYIFFSITFFLTSIIIYNTFGQDISFWSLGELLINYEGGFVRRGLLGEIVYLTNNPIFYVTVLQKIIFLGFVIGTALLILLYKDMPSKILFTLIFILSPGSLYDMATGGELEYIDRKEIWFYNAMLLIIYFSSKYCFHSLKTVILITFISTIMILHHELYAVFFAPIILIIFWLKIKDDKPLVVRNSAIYIISIFLIFLLVSIYHGNYEIVNDIKMSYAKYNIHITGGIDAIAWSFSKSSALSLEMLTKGSIIYWIFFGALAIGMSLLFALVTFMKSNHSIFALFMIFSLILSMIIGFISGWDWGRWISMYSMGIVLSFSLLKVVLNKDVRKDYLYNTQMFTFFHSNLIKNNVFIVMIVLFVLISLITRMDHCCPKKSMDIFYIPISIKNMTKEHFNS